MEIREKGYKKVITLLVIIVLVLLAVIAYSFFAKPAINAYVVQQQNNAVRDVLGFMLMQIQQQGYTVITDVSQNQSIVLVPMQQQNQQLQ